MQCIGLFHLVADGSTSDYFIIMDVKYIVPVSVVNPTLCLSETHSDLRRAIAFCVAVVSCSAEELITLQSQTRIYL